MWLGTVVNLQKDDRKGASVTASHNTSTGEGDSMVGKQLTVDLEDAIIVEGNGGVKEQCQVNQFRK